MAYINDLSDDEKKKAEEQGQGVRTSGVIESQATTQGNEGAVATPTTAPGTGFVNLQQYLDTNKGVGGKLAGDITKGVSDSADAFKTNANATVDQSKTNFASASKDTDTAKINDTLKTDASGIYSDASKFLGAGYSGPQAIDYTAKLAADKNAVQGNLSQVDNQAYQQAALKDTYGKSGNPYTQGFGLLDSFLINGDQSGRDQLNAVKAKGSEVGAAYDTSALQLSTAEQAARDKLAANKKAIVDTAKTEKGNILNTGAAKVEDLNKTLDANKVETSKASLGDVFVQKNYDDLDALANLSLEGGQWDKNKTFNAGKDKPVPVAPPPPPVVAPPPEPVIEMPPPINGFYAADGKPGENKDFGPVTEAGRMISNNVDKLDKLTPWIDTMSDIGGAPGAIWDSTRELLEKPSMDRLKDVGTEIWKPVGATLDVAKNVVDESGRLLDKTVGETLRNTGDVASKAYEDTKAELKRISMADAQAAARKMFEEEGLKKIETEKAEAAAAKAAEDTARATTKARDDAARAAAKAEADARAAAEQAAKDLSIRNAQAAAQKAKDDAAAALKETQRQASIKAAAAAAQKAKDDAARAAKKAKDDAAAAAKKAADDAANAAKNAKKNVSIKNIKKKLSDERAKDNVLSIPRDDIAEFLTHVQPYYYTYLNAVNGEGVHPGFMAQDLLKSKIGRAIVSEGENGVLEIDTWKLQGALLATMKLMFEGK